MLTTTCELWPFGDKSAAKRLVTINIANMGHSMRRDGYDYVWTIDEPEPLTGQPIHAEGVIEGYDRNASCVAMLGAVIDAYQRQPFVRHPDMIPDEIETAKRMRDKTK